MKIEETARGASAEDVKTRLLFDDLFSDGVRTFKTPTEEGLVYMQLFGDHLEDNLNNIGQWTHKELAGVPIKEMAGADLELALALQDGRYRLDGKPVDTALVSYQPSEENDKLAQAAWTTGRRFLSLYLYMHKSSFSCWPLHFSYYLADDADARKPTFVDVAKLAYLMGTVSYTHLTLPTILLV